MPITPEHAFKEKSTKLLILLPLRTSYNRTFQCETPCITLLTLTKYKRRGNVFTILVKTKDVYMYLL